MSLGQKKGGNTTDNQTQGKLCAHLLTEHREQKIGVEKLRNEMLAGTATLTHQINGKKCVEKI